MLDEPHFAGHVEGAANADRAVDEHPTDVGDRLLALALQQVVHCRPRIPEIAEEVADDHLHRQRSRGIVALRHRFDDHVQTFIDREHGPVETLERIPGVVGRRRTAAGSNHRCAASQA
jgi:hypothetical protein